MTEPDLCFDELCAKTDEELAAAASTSKAAANALFLRYSKLIIIKANLLSDLKSDVDDLCQEGLIGLMRAIESFDAQRNVKFSTFAEVCIVNRMRSYLTKTRKIPAAQSLDDLAEEMLPDDETPESLYMNKELFDELWYAVDNILSESERQVFSLCVKGCSYAEAAKKLNISVKSVDNAMQRARRKIREYCAGRM